MISYYYSICLIYLSTMLDSFPFPIFICFLNSNYKLEYRLVFITQTRFIILLFHQSQSMEEDIKPPGGGKKVISYTQQIFPIQDVGAKYKVKKIIGKGSYGYVAKAVRKSDNSYVAIKKIANLFQSAPETRRILREIVLLKQCNHPNIVRLIDIIIPKNQTIDHFTCIYLVTEFCDSDLQKVFKNQGMFFQIDDVRIIAYQILCGLNYLHSADIIHRDLKPANVLINGNGPTIKICDFGLARMIQNKSLNQNQESNSDEDDDPLVIQKPEIQSIKNKQITKQVVNSEKEESLSKKKKLVRADTKKLQKQEEKDTQKIKKQEQLSNPMSKLTLRVTTRWYRAPEVILLEKGYHKPIDMWSVGCIFGELIKMQKSVCQDVLHRFPLFPGKYCYPVSPNTLGVVYKNGYPQGRNDQLAMILSTIGKPTEEEMNFLTDQNAKDYLRKMESRQRKKYSDMFPQVQAQVTSILENTLKFDPRKRMTVSEALNLKFFDECRSKKAEMTRAPIKMQFQKFETELTNQKLKQYFAKQLVEFFSNGK